MVKMCAECGGIIRPVKKPGRFDSYKGMRLSVPADIEIPTCEDCGEEYSDEIIDEKIDAALEREYQKRLKKRLISALNILTKYISMAQLERKLGLSEGYLSKLKRECRELRPRVPAQIYSLAQDPENRLRELDRFWDEPENDHTLPDEKISLSK